MASLKSVSAVTRSQVLAAVRLCHSSVLDCSPRKLYPVSVSRRVCQESVKNVQHSSSILHHHQYKGLSPSEPWILDDNVNRTHAASSLPNSDALQYVCPSRLTQLFSQLVIMDNVADRQRHYHCPVLDALNISKVTPTSQRGGTEIFEPPEGRRSSDFKEAKEIMRIRHKKMKKHKLRKLRKRMYFLWKRQKATRKAKRDAIYWKEISDIKKEAEDFSAEAFVNEQLEKARKGGFYMKVMDSKHS